MANKQPVDLSTEVKKIIDDYAWKGRGPAHNHVLRRAENDFKKLVDTVKKIPGKPQNVKVIGRGRDRIKLSWEPPERNPEAAEMYIVSKMREGRLWEDVIKTNKTKVLVKGLKSNTKYEFRVQATNHHVEGQIDKSSTETKWSAAANAAAGAGLGAGFGFATAIAAPAFIVSSDPNAGLIDGAFRVGMCVVALPISLALSVVTAPLCAVGGAVIGAVIDCEGDLTEE